MIICLYTSRGLCVTIAASGGMVLKMGTLSMCSKELSAEVAIDMQQVSMPSMHGWNLNLNQNKCFFFFFNK